MKKVSLFFNLNSYEEYTKYLNLLFEEIPELKNESRFYQSLKEHNKTINDLVLNYKKMDTNDDEQFYLFCFLPSLTIVSTNNKQHLLQIYRFIFKNDLVTKTKLKSDDGINDNGILSSKGL